MGRYEVTQGQWKAVMGGLPPKMSELSLDFKGDDLPVVGVSWDAAREFIDRLNKLTGGDYRLPSEAEWEFAARAGSQDAFSFGPAITPEVANYNGNYPYGQTTKGTNEGYPVRVGSYPANAFGLFDMHGNVNEWCEDNMRGNYDGAPADGRAWTDTSDITPYMAKNRIYRGGSWKSSAVFLQSAYREWGLRDNGRNNHIGFRLSRTASVR
jgi:formylglycine-generating enzyme required for sulfatase activity